MDKKRELTKRELAVTELERRKNKGRGSEAATRLSKTDDPTLVLKNEIEKDKQRNTMKMLEKSKKKNESMSGKVKNFMDKLAPTDKVKVN